jgi:hypothetical protein
MLFVTSLSLLTLPVIQVLATPLVTRADAAPVNVTTCGGKKYVYEELAGYGKLPASFRDKYGDTLGGIGSAIALDQKSTKYKKSKGAYEGIIYGLPDRGWNTQGTQNTQSRIHKFSFTFEVVQDATVDKPASPNFKLQYLDTLLLTGPDGTPLTGLDPTGTVTYKGFPDLPLAKCTFLGLFFLAAVNVLQILVTVLVVVEPVVRAFPWTLKVWCLVTMIPTGSVTNMVGIPNSRIFEDTNPT